MDKKLYWGVITSALIGFAVSVYMAIYKLTDNEAMCLGSGECSIVNDSRYSEIYGIPLGIVGALGYAAILFVLWLEKNHPIGKEYGNMLTMGITFAGTLFSMYLMYISHYVIQATCPFCVASAIAMTLCFVLSLIRFLRTEN